jgi:hypothetical protein
MKELSFTASMYIQFAAFIVVMESLTNLLTIGRFANTAFKGRT